MKLTEEYLRKQLYENNKTINDIASETGLQRQTISSYLKKYNLNKKSFLEKLQEKISKDKLTKLYIDDNMTAKQIGKIYNTTEISILKLIHLYDINKDGVTYQSSKRKENKNILTKDFLLSEYKNKSIQIISQETNISRKVISKKLQEYGIENDNKKDVIKRANMYKYGVDNYSKTSECKEKMRKTNLERYNVPSYSQTDMFKNFVKKSTISQMNLESNRTQEQINILNDKNKLIEFINGLPETERNLYTISEKLSYNVKHVAKEIHKYEIENLINYHINSSQYENEIISILNNIGITNIERNTKKYLDGLEIDIYLPDYNFGIEFNGDYWHSDIFKSDHNGRSKYHQQKSLLAESKNIFLYNIFEYEWIDVNIKEKIINHLKNILKQNSEKIYARKCEIKKVSSSEKEEFYNINHLQGNCNSSHNIGLYYNNELVSMMSFNKRTTGKYKYELVRFCSKYGTNVIGGASKLFKYFLDNNCNDGDKIISFSNITKTTGNLYKVLNFKFDHISDPNYIWINLASRDIKTRYQTKMKNEVSIMHSNNYVRICDCGTKTWIYTK